jgi:hypothetical protein
MAERKPPGKSWRSWVEEQIQQAQTDGEFDQLEGKGKPIPGIEAPYDPLWWVKKLLERERVSLLPAALEIRAKVDQALENLWALDREEAVREHVAAINRDIARANHTAAAGPPTTLGLLDVDVVLSQWRSRRSSAAPSRSKERR